MTRETQVSRSGLPAAYSLGAWPRTDNGDHDDQASQRSEDGSVQTGVFYGDPTFTYTEQHDPLSGSTNVSTKSNHTMPFSTPTQGHRTPTGQWSGLVTPGGSRARSPSPNAEEISYRPQISIEQSSILDLGGIGAHIPDELGGFTDWHGQLGHFQSMDLLEDDFLHHHDIRAYLRSSRADGVPGGEGNSLRTRDEPNSATTTAAASLPNPQPKPPNVTISPPGDSQKESTPVPSQPPELANTASSSFGSWSAELPSRSQQHLAHAIHTVWEGPNEDAWISLPEEESSLLALGGANDFPTFSSQYQTLTPIGFDAQSAPPVMSNNPGDATLNESCNANRPASELEYMEVEQGPRQGTKEASARRRRSRSDGGGTRLEVDGTGPGWHAQGRRLLRSSQRKAKGRRRGPLPDGTRMSAREVRIKQTVCISCKRNKTRCLKLDGESLCTACAARAGRSQGHICALACFAHYARAASYDPIARCGLWHVIPSSLQVHRLALPETISPDWLGFLLTEYPHIRVSYIDATSAPPEAKTLYEMDVEMCLNQLRAEINGRTLSAYADGSAALPQPLACLSPSSRQILTAEHMLDLCDRNLSGQRFFTYSLLHTDGTSLELNPLEPTNAETIQRAAQICYLLNRCIEVNAYKSLQEKLTAAFKGGKPTVDPLLPSIVARLACSLRFRAHLWHASGICGKKEEIEGLACVKLMCRTLAGYYLEMKRAGVVDGEEGGRWIRYSGTGKVVYDEFPGEYSEDGLRGWFEEGGSKVKEAQVNWSYLQPMQK